MDSSEFPILLDGSSGAAAHIYKDILELMVGVVHLGYRHCYCLGLIYLVYPLYTFVPRLGNIPFRWPVSIVIRLPQNEQYVLVVVQRLVVKEMASAGDSQPPGGSLPAGLN